MKRPLGVLMIVGFILLVSSAALAVTPVIRANGSKGQIDISQGTPLAISIEINADDRFGRDADWWLAYSVASQWDYYDVVGGSWSWKPGLSVTYQGPLFSFGTFNVLDTSTLPVGSYIFYFGCDMIMNGSVDSDQLYFDYVIVNVTNGNNAVPGAWSGEGLTFTVTSDGRILDLVHTYAGLCQCMFTMNNIAIASNTFSLQNSAIGFSLSGAFMDATHMSAQVFVDSPDCALSGDVITAEKVPD